MQQIKDLFECREGPAVSIYMPVSGIARDPYKLGAHFKSLLRQAGERLGPRGTDVLAPVGALGGHQGPWRTAMPGLAVFLAPGFSKIMWLGYDPGSSVEVGEAFNLRLLTPLMEPASRYFILTVDPKVSALYEANRFGEAPIEDEIFRDRLSEIVAQTELPANVGSHAAGPTRATGDAASAKYHSQGESPEDYKQVELDEFVHQLAKTVDSHLTGETAPLVLVADPNLLGMCRRHLTYQGLEAEAVDKNPSGLDAAELQNAAFEVVRPTLRGPRKEACARYEAMAGRGEKTATDSTKDIVAAAVNARVDSLFVDPAHPVWGRVENANGLLRVEVDESDEPAADEIDLTNRAILDTLRNGGTVYRLGGKSAAAEECALRAILRY